jgi:hypothetical protein
MIKIHSIANPITLDDIVSILINIDGFLDDTMDLRVFASEEDRQQFSSVAAGTLQALLTKSFNKFQLWWLDFAEEVRRLTDEFLAKTPEEKREISYNRIIKMLEDFLPGAEDVKALIEHSSYGRQLIETDF